MKIKIAWMGKTKEPAIQALTDEYLKRISRNVLVEGIPLRDETALLQLCGLLPSKAGKRNTGKSTLVLMESRGNQFSSEEFAGFLRDYQDRNPLPLVFAVGPADGFTEEARAVGAAYYFTGKDDPAARTGSRSFAGADLSGFHDFEGTSLSFRPLKQRGVHLRELFTGIGTPTV